MDPQWEPGQGHRLPPYARTDLALRGAADLLCRLHAAASGFQPAITSYRNHPRPARAGPVSPLADLADAAWTFVPLAPPRQPIEVGFDPIPDLPARLRMFVEAYGLADRKAIVPALERSMTGAAVRPANAVDAASLQWLQGESTMLARAL